MSLTVAERIQDGEHQWAVLHANCDPRNGDDPLVAAAALRIRRSYGEEALLAKIATLTPDPQVEEQFDLRNILDGFRAGLPDPSNASDAPKKSWLRNYRSESCEVLAVLSISAAFSVSFPSDPQRGKTNPDQPILGFDNWGISEVVGSPAALVLVQVKGTEQAKRPPDVADALVAECRAACEQRPLLSRALSILAINVEDDHLARQLIEMLGALGRNEDVCLVVAPSIVRGGQMDSAIDDLTSIRAAASSFSPSRACGISVSIRASLEEFGAAVTAKAREAA